MNADYEALKKQIASLPPRQYDACSAICTGSTPRGGKAVLGALERKGLVVSYERKLHFLDGLPPMTVTDWDVSTHAVHIAWCDVSASKLTPEELAELER